MRYLGGKSRIGKHIAAELARRLPPRSVIWEPFCGGLGATEALCKAGFQVICSDSNVALVSTIQAVRNGWDPPKEVSLEEYREAKQLPDSNPRKAFLGFGCSFGGKWFGGFARGKAQNYANQSRKVLLKQAPLPLQVCQGSFFEIEPFPATFAIYADPPYEGTTGYGGVPEFEHGAFWRKCATWVSCGVPVFVSEYSAPKGWAPIWTKEVLSTVSKDKAKKPRTEHLFSTAGTELICKARSR